MDDGRLIEGTLDFPSRNWRRRYSVNYYTDSIYLLNNDTFIMKDKDTMIIKGPGGGEIGSTSSSKGPGGEEIGGEIGSTTSNKGPRGGAEG